MSVLGFPEELNFQMLKSMYPSRKTEYRKAPMNSQSFSSAGQDVQLVLNKMENTFYDPGTLCVNFTVDYTGMTAGVSGTDGNFILGSAYSHFSRQVIKPMSGQPIETIDNPSLLVNAVMNMTTDPIQKQALSTTLGFSATPGTLYSNLGSYIVQGSAQTSTQSFSIPLIGILNTSKLIPGFITDIEIDLTVNSVSEFILTVAGGAGTTITAGSSVTGFTIKNVELVCEALTLEESGMQQLMTMFPGVIKIKSQSFLYGSSTLAAQSGAGAYDITYSHALNSLKQFLWWSSPADANDKKYGGVNPNLNSWQLIIGSTSYPQQPVKADKPSECFMQNQKSYGSLYSTSHNGSSLKSNFSKASTAGGEYYAYSNNTLRTYANTTTPDVFNKWYQALDVEVINGMKETLYNGISTKGSTNTLRLNVARQLANSSHAIQFYSHFDTILEFDYTNGVINVIQ
jgi:hypothetical protein